MTIAQIHRTIFKADGVLWLVGWLHLFVVVVCAGVLPFDSRRVAGASPWFQPILYAASITLYVWTLAWLIRYVSGPVWAKRTIRWGTFLLMPAATFCIVLQAALGRSSHAAPTELFDAQITQTMVFALVANALLALLLLLLFLWQETTLAPAYWGGIVTGLTLFIAGCGLGVWMMIQTLMTVEPPPMARWRLLHIACLHGLQAASLAGYWISGRSPEASIEGLAQNGVSRRQ
jgi:hypothetical protein